MNNILVNIAYGELDGSDELINGIEGVLLGGDRVSDETGEGQGGSIPSVELQKKIQFVLYCVGYNITNARCYF
jgi:hypothetical protein